MATYIETTRFATLQLFNIIASINNTLAEIAQNLELVAQHQQRLADLNLRLESARDPKGCDPEKHAATVLSLEKQIQEYRDSFADSETRMKEFRQKFEYVNQASDALRMAVLQIAKQGISAIRGKVDSCPDGRMIGSQPLKTIIWEARNQAIHHEDSKPHKGVRQCFDTLAAEFGDRFSLTKHSKKNLATEVFHLLEWVDYPAYEPDIRSLLEP